VVNATHHTPAVGGCPAIYDLGGATPSSVWITWASTTMCCADRTSVVGVGFREVRGGEPGTGVEAMHVQVQRLDRGVGQEADVGAPAGGLAANEHQGR
jgi:hypothetical protein